MFLLSTNLEFAQSPLLYNKRVFSYQFEFGAEIRIRIQLNNGNDVQESQQVLQLRGYSISLLYNAGQPL